MLANNVFEKFEFRWITHGLIQTPYNIIFAVDVFVPDLINNCLPILGSILERGARGWHVQYRQKMMRDLQGQWSYWLHTCIYIITTRTWSYDLEHVLLPVANHQIKGDVKRKIWSDDARLAQQDMVQLMVISSQKPFYRNMFKMHENQCCLLCATCMSSISESCVRN